MYTDGIGAQRATGERTVPTASPTAAGVAPEPTVTELLGGARTAAKTASTRRSVSTVS